ncbi:hypothetical protein L5515_016471 [Caenorhabditis briggsae]|uniref:Uncharacterized protein n=1 Tax=Caenorhabditis briggsae TaxID=6238 RepID=A0AAE9JPF2_CAEBR|nr:hypothetical protein L5515_016471 [Caenorhabditis briggsae]
MRINAPSRAETSSSESSDSDSESSSPPPPLQEVKSKESGPLKKAPELEKLENVAGWERSDSFEAVYGDVEQADPRGEVSEGSIYVPTPKASPANDANYCLFGGEHSDSESEFLNGYSTINMRHI